MRLKFWASTGEGEAGEWVGERGYSMRSSIEKRIASSMSLRAWMRLAWYMATSRSRAAFIVAASSRVVLAEGFFLRMDLGMLVAAMIRFLGIQMPELPECFSLVFMTGMVVF